MNILTSNNSVLKTNTQALSSNLTWTGPIIPVAHAGLEFIFYDCIPIVLKINTLYFYLTAVRNNELTLKTSDNSNTITLRRQDGKTFYRGSYIGSVSSWSALLSPLADKMIITNGSLAYSTSNHTSIYTVQGNEYYLGQKTPSNITNNYLDFTAAQSTVLASNTNLLTTGSNVLANTTGVAACPVYNAFKLGALTISDLYVYFDTNIVSDHRAALKYALDNQSSIGSLATGVGILHCFVYTS